MAILFKNYPSSGQVISEYPIVSRGLYTDTRLSYLLFKLRNTCLEGVCRDPKYFKLTKLKINGSRYEVLSKCHTKIRTKMTMWRSWQVLNHLISIVKQQWSLCCLFVPKLSLTEPAPECHNIAKNVLYYYVFVHLLNIWVHMTTPKWGALYLQFWWTFSNFLFCIS